MKIGNIDLGPRPVLLAPMEDVTDASFRILCKEQGADMVYTGSSATPQNPSQRCIPSPKRPL